MRKLLVVSAVLFMFVSAQAGDRAGRSGLEIHGACLRYDMGDLNAALKDITSITQGYEAGFTLMKGYGRHFIGALSFDHRWAGTSFTVRDASGGQEVTISLPAVSTGLGFQKVLPEAIGRLDLRAGLKVTLDILTGAEIKTVANGRTTGLPLNGMAWGGVITLGADYFLTDDLAVGLEVGHRQCRIDRVNATLPTGSVSALNNGDSEISVDYSGLTVCLGTSLWF
jgi:hypothetical protein